MRSENGKTDKTPDASFALGLSHEASLMAVLAFFGLKIALFFSKRQTPDILSTTLIMLPCAYIKDLGLSKFPKAI